MILQSITLHNFMSYADACLDLSAIAVACLCGQNGAGKSALLDAFTWAVWEEARAGSDKLIRQEQKEMWVDVVFSHEGNNYRVRRTRQIAPSRSGTKVNSKGALDLYVNSNKADWVSLTAASTKETQQKICQLLKMEYQTFVDSAYLKQGAADQFASKLPSERKEVLAKILGLAEFDRLQELCRERLRPLKEKCERLAKQMERLPELEAQIKLWQEENDSTEADLKKAKTARDEYENNLLALQKKQHEIFSRYDKQKSIKGQLNALADEIAKLHMQKEELHKRFAGLNELANQQGALETEFSKYKQAIVAAKELDEKFFTAQNLDKQKSEMRVKLSQERAELEAQLRQTEKETEELLRRQQQLLVAVKNQETITAEYKQYQNCLNTEDDLARKQEAYTQISQRRFQLQSVIDEAEMRLAIEIDQKQKQLTQLKAITDGDTLLEKQKKELKEQELELDKKEHEFQFVLERGQQVKGAIEVIERQIVDLKQEQKDYEHKIEELNKAADSTICPLCSAPIIDRAAVIRRYADSIDQAKRTILTHEHDKHKLEEERKSLLMRYGQLNAELAARKELDKQIGQFQEKVRTVQNTKDQAEKLEQSIALLTERKEKKDCATVERASLIRLNDELNQLQFDQVLYDSIKAQNRSQRGIEMRFNQLQRDAAELKQIETELPELIKKIEFLKVTLSEESYGSSNRDVIRYLEKQLQEIDYDASKHSAVREQLVVLTAVADKYKDSQRALSEISVLEKNIEDKQKWLSDKLEHQAVLNQELETVSSNGDNLADIEREINAAQELVNAIKSDYDVIVHKQAKIMANKERAEKELEELTEEKKELTETKAALEDFSFLAECFGKKGIQAIIIENAIPEIEADANRILSRLTDNKMHVALITQQKNKSGNIAETLDIEINDQLGQRNYELYSGGEAFKVNFAIRVALSRLLARRAGAKLETLIIDEGFGSQDDHSRDRLVKAINSIQSDFARILVITHFSDVKEMFPNHILINKSSGTSQIELIN